MSLLVETSKRALANATARDLEEFKKWLSTYSPAVFHLSHAHPGLQPDIDPVAAKTPFFAHENAAKWVVLEQWHTYRMQRRHEQRHALSRSGAATNHITDG